MRCGLVLTVVFATVACCLSSTRPHAEPADGGACAAITRDLKGQIETIKELNAHTGNVFNANSKKHGKPEDPQKAASRAREQAETLNAMLPGMGCERLDIDHELTLPENQALLPATQKSSKKHRTQ